MEKTKSPCAIHGGSGVSYRCGEDEGNIETHKNQGRGTSTKEAEGEGKEDREAPSVTTTTKEVEEEVCDVKTSVSTALIAEAVCSSSGFIRIEV